MSVPLDNESGPESFTLVRYAKPSESVWRAPNGVGDLELFANFMMMFDSRQCPTRISASIPEALLMAAGYVFPNIVDIGELPIPTSRLQRTAPIKDYDGMPVVDAQVRTTDQINEHSFLGASVEGTIRNVASNQLGADVMPISAYVQESAWDASVPITHLVFRGWLLEEFANSIALTVQTAA